GLARLHGAARAATVAAGFVAVVAAFTHVANAIPARDRARTCRQLIDAGGVRFGAVDHDHDLGVRLDRHPQPPAAGATELAAGVAAARTHREQQVRPRLQLELEHPRLLGGEAVLDLRPGGAARAARIGLGGVPEGIA